MKSLPARVRRTLVGTARLGVAGLLGLTLAGCSHADPGVAAYVGNDEVTQSQVDQAVKGLAPVVQPGQNVSVQAVVNAMIDGELAEQIAADKKIELTATDRDAVLKGTNLAGLVNVPDAQPLVQSLADRAIVSNKLGGEPAYLAEATKLKVVLNPRYGVIDPAKNQIAGDQSGSLSVPAPNASVAAP